VTAATIDQQDKRRNPKLSPLDSLFVPLGQQVDPKRRNPRSVRHPSSRRKPRSFLRSVKRRKGYISLPEGIKCHHPNPTHVLSPGLLVVHDSSRGGKDDLSERTSGQQDVDPVLDCNTGQNMVSHQRDHMRCIYKQDVLASKVTLNRGEMTPVLFNRPLSWMTIFPPRWSSMSSNSPM
jgi:hypothetical protein